MTPSAPQLPSADGKSSTVRDFIYLDEPKVFSYLAQIEGGLRLLKQRVENALDITSEETGGDKTAGEHQIEAGVNPTVAAVLGSLGVAGAAAGLPLGLLAGLNAKYNYQRSWENGTPILKTINHDGASNSDLTVLHHAAFDLVMRELQGNFITVTGHASLVGLEMVNKMMNIAGIVAANSDTARGFQVLEAMQVENILFVENGRDFVHSVLRNEHFVVPPAYFNGIYGSPTEIEFTIVGIKAQRPNRPGKIISPKQATSQESKDLFGALTGSFDLVAKLFGMDSASRLYPIAVYRDFKSN